jgi:hypothetical protein
MRWVPTHEEITRHTDVDPDENPWVIGPPPPESVMIVPYDPQWPHLYDTLAEQIQLTLGEKLLEVEHVGSTSVPGLSANRPSTSTAACDCPNRG